MISVECSARADVTGLLVDGELRGASAGAAGDQRVGEGAKGATIRISRSHLS